MKIKGNGERGNGGTCHHILTPEHAKLLGLEHPWRQQAKQYQAKPKLILEPELKQQL